MLTGTFEFLSAGKTNQIAEFRLFGDHDGVNDMNHAVISLDIGCDNCGIVDSDNTTLDTDSEGGTVDGGDSSSIHGHNGFSHNLAGQNVVGEDTDKLVLVLWQQQTGHSSLWQLSESIVSWGKDSKWAGTFQGVNQTGGSESSSQGGERSGSDSSVYNICHAERCGGRADKGARGSWGKSGDHGDKGESECDSLHHFGFVLGLRFTNYEI